MSKNITKKGVALGAALALGVSGLAGAPAFAADALNVSLIPSQGTELNSILQSGAILYADLNEFDTDTEDDESDLTFLVENPGEASVTIDFNGANATTGTGGAWQQQINQDTKATLDAVIALNQKVVTTADPAVGVGDIDQIQVATASTKKFMYASGTAVTDSDTSTGGDTGQVNRADVSTQNNALVIATDETTDNVTLYVTAWLDRNDNGVVDSFEDSSNRQTVVLYSPANVTATTAMSSAVTREADDVMATVVYGLGINENWVDTDTSVAFYLDGVSLATDTSDGGTNSNVSNASDGIVLPLVGGSGTLDSLDRITTVANYTGDSADNVAGIYSARAIYTASSPDVFIGSPSAALDLSDGSNADVDKILASVTSTDDILYDKATTANEAQLRTGTKSVTVNAQAYDGTEKLLESNIKVKAVVTGRTVTAGNNLSVTAAAGTITEALETITANAFTDASGKVSFTVNALLGTKSDAFDIEISVLDTNGDYVVETNNTSGDLDVKWVDGALTSFAAEGGSYASGSSVAVTVNAEDQFGVGMDATASGALSVYAVAVLGGVETPETYSATVSTSGGAASMSFANFATEGTSQILKVSLYEGRSVVSSPAALSVSVYNTLESASITMADSFSTAIHYTDFAEGKVATLVAPITSETVVATVSGTVLNANNVGQPGALVTLSGEGVLFKDEVNYSLGSITTKANEFGTFSVTASSHEVSSAGHAISVTADGLTDSTLLKTFLPNTIADENLQFSWNFPANLVKNTTYALTATLMDSWGNPINATDPTTASAGTDFGIAFTGTGSVEINGVAATVYKNFTSKGEATVFVRSIKDVAGPGSVTASLGAEAQYNTSESATSTSTLAAMSATNTVDNLETVWDETLWASSLTVEVDVLDAAPVVASSDTKVNVGTFSGKLVVYALNAAGSEVSYKIAGKWVTQVVTSDSLMRYDRVVGATGMTIKVDIYVDGVLMLAKSVVTK